MISPAKVRRSAVVVNYLSSPSPVKKSKEVHCYFCSFKGETASSLEDHLTQSINCSKAYMRLFKCKDLRAILVKSFPCYFCKSGSNIRISCHLRNKKDCKEKYCRMFNVNSEKEIFAELEKLKQKLRPSRTKAKRTVYQE